MKTGAIAIFLGGSFSKVVGFLREVLFASWFGVSDLAVGFRVAQSGFLLPTHSLVGETLSAGLLPLYKSSLGASTDRAKLLRCVATLYASFLSFVIFLFLIAFSEYWVTAIAPGMNEGSKFIASSFLKIMAFAVPFYILGGMFSYIEAAHGSFTGISLRPVLMNVGAIVGGVLAVKLEIASFIAIGFTAGHVFIFSWALWKIWPEFKNLPRASVFASEFGGVARKFLRTIAPLMIIPLFMQGNVWVERVVSSRIDVVLIPAVDYARVVSDTFIQLISVPLGVMAMSSLAGKDKYFVKSQASRVVLIMFTLFLPASVFAAQFSFELVKLLFQRGNFDIKATAITSSILFWFCLGMTFGAIGYYLIKVLNTQFRNKLSMIIIGVACLGNVIANLTLGGLLGSSVIGVGYLVNCLLMFGLCTYFVGVERSHFSGFALVAALSICQMLVTKAVMPHLVGPMGLIVGGCIVGLTYILAYRCVRNFREAVTEILFRRFRRKVN